MKKVSITIIGILAISSCNWNSKTTTLEKQIVVAYVTEWKEGWGTNVELAKTATHINYAFANIVDGKVTEGGAKDRGDLQRLRRFKEVNADLQILISIGGWEWSGNFSDAALTKSSRLKFCNSAIGYMLRHQIDGIDIDWEYPGLPGKGNTHRSEDKENFTSLLKLMRAKLDSVGELNERKYLLTIATAANKEYLDHVEMDQIVEYLDLINVMTYDYTGSWDEVTGHHSNLFASAYNQDTDTPNTSKSISEHLNAGVPGERLIVGVPFYGRFWRGVMPNNSGLHQRATGSGGSMNYKDIVDSLAQNNQFESLWDSTAQAPYVWNPEDSTFISYENERSLSEKMKFIKAKKLGGVMFWQYSGDNGDLLKTIKNFEKQ